MSDLVFPVGQPLLRRWCADELLQDEPFRRSMLDHELAKLEAAGIPREVLRVRWRRVQDDGRLLVTNTPPPVELSIHITRRAANAYT